MCHFNESGGLEITPREEEIAQLKVDFVNFTDQMEEVAKNSGVSIHTVERTDKNLWDAVHGRVPTLGSSRRSS